MFAVLSEAKWFARKVHKKQDDHHGVIMKFFFCGARGHQFPVTPPGYTASMDMRKKHTEAYRAGAQWRKQNAKV